MVSDTTMKAYIPVIKLVFEVILVLATIFGTLFMKERESKDGTPRF